MFGPILGRLAHLFKLADAFEDAPKAGHRRPLLPRLGSGFEDLFERGDLVDVAPQGVPEEWEIPARRRRDARRSGRTPAALAGSASHRRGLQEIPSRPPDRLAAPVRASSVSAEPATSRGSWASTSEGFEFGEGDARLWIGFVVMKIDVELPHSIRVKLELLLRSPTTKRKSQRSWKRQALSPAALQGLRESRLVVPMRVRNGDGMKAAGFCVHALVPWERQEGFEDCFVAVVDLVDHRDVSLLQSSRSSCDRRSPSLYACRSTGPKRSSTVERAESSV